MQLTRKRFRARAGALDKALNDWTHGAVLQRHDRDGTLEIRAQGFQEVASGTERNDRAW